MLLPVLILSTSGCSFILRSSSPNPGTGQSVANGRSSAPSISGDGRYTVFLSDASNLVTGDTNGVMDVFVRNNSTQAVTRFTDGAVDANSNPTISADGSRIAYTVVEPFPSGGSRCEIAVVNIAPVSIAYTDLALGNTNLQCNENPTLSANGAVVAYEENYVFGFNNAYMRTGNGAISSPARTNNTLTGRLTDLKLDASGTALLFDTDQGNLVTGDTNGTFDVFKYVPTAAVKTTRVSLTNSGGQGNDSSAYGSWCEGSGSDNNGIVFASFASNLVTGDTNGHQDIFERMAVVTSAGGTFSLVAGNGDSSLPSCSGFAGSDGNRFMSFVSKATNLVPGDTNNTSDVFVYDRYALSPTPAITRTSVDLNLNQANGPSSWPQISEDGRWVSYESDASNLVGGDTNGVTDVYTSNTLKPTLASMSPSRLVRGVVNYPVTITGTGFFSPLRLTSSDGTITFTNVSITDENHLTAKITVPTNAEVSPQLIASIDGTPVNSYGSAAICACFTTFQLQPPPG